VKVKNEMPIGKTMCASGMDKPASQFMLVIMKSVYLNIPSAVRSINMAQKSAERAAYIFATAVI
jgi:hypothetical protein